MAPSIGYLVGCFCCSSGIRGSVVGEAVVRQFSLVSLLLREVLRNVGTSGVYGAKK